jgi:thiamine-phosphate diphosphorylase
MPDETTTPPTRSRTSRAEHPLARCKLQLLFTPELCPNGSDPWRVLDLALDAGIDLVQWRVKRDAPAELDRCAAACARRDVPLIVNDDVAAARRIGAAGAHVGQDDLPAAEARALLGPDRWLGVSTHSLAEVEAAVAAGADCLGFGPMFPTATKGYRHAQPEGALRAVLDATDLPVFAIGGLDPERVRALVAREGLTHAAVSSCVLTARRPELVVRALRSALAVA